MKNIGQYDIDEESVKNLFLTWHMPFLIKLPKIPMDLWNVSKQVGPYELEDDHQSRLPPNHQSAKIET